MPTKEVGANTRGYNYVYYKQKGNEELAKAFLGRKYAQFEKRDRIGTIVTVSAGAIALISAIIGFSLLGVSAGTSVWFLLSAKVSVVILHTGRTISECSSHKTSKIFYEKLSQYEIDTIIQNVHGAELQPIIPKLAN